MAAVRSLYGIHRKRPDGVGELAFGQCHSSLGNGGPRKWPGWHARLPFAARRCEVNRPRQEIMGKRAAVPRQRSEENKSELQSLMRTPYAGFCMKKQNKQIKKVLLYT